MLDAQHSKLVIERLGMVVNLRKTVHLPDELWSLAGWLESHSDRFDVIADLLKALKERNAVESVAVSFCEPRSLERVLVPEGDDAGSRECALRQVFTEFVRAFATALLEADHLELFHQTGLLGQLRMLTVEAVVMDNQRVIASPVAVMEVLAREGNLRRMEILKFKIRDKTQPSVDAAHGALTSSELLQSERTTDEPLLSLHLLSASGRMDLGHLLLIISRATRLRHLTIEFPVFDDSLQAPVWLGRLFDIIASLKDLADLTIRVYRPMNSDTLPSNAHMLKADKYALRDRLLLALSTLSTYKLRKLHLDILYLHGISPTPQQLQYLTPLLSSPQHHPWSVGYFNYLINPFERLNF